MMKTSMMKTNMMKTSMMKTNMMNAESDFEPSPPSIVTCPEDTCTVEEGEGTVVQVNLNCFTFIS